MNGSRRPERPLMLTPTEVAHRYVELLAAGDLAGLGDLFADDVIWHQPGAGHLSGVYRGKAEVFPHLGRFTTLSSASFRVEEVIDVMANDDLVATSLRFSASAARATLSMRGIDLMRITDGKIREMWLFSADQPAEDRFWDDAAAPTTRQ